MNGKNKKFPVILLSAVLAVALIFGGVFGTIAAVRNSRAVMKYNGLTADEGTCHYLASVAKTEYLSQLARSGVAFVDEPVFYAKTAASGKTYGEELAAYVETYIRETLVCASLFDKYSRMTKSDREKLDGAIAEVLDYRADGSIDSFNENTEAMGFDYKAFRKGAELTYKAAHAMTVIYGSGGSNMRNFPDDCDTFLSEHYVHVQLLYIRTETKFETDGAGNRVSDGEGHDKTVALTAAEKQERQDDIAAIDAAIETYRTGVGTLSITPQMFGLYVNKYDDGDDTAHTYGYYFAEDSAYTAEFSEAFPEIVSEVGKTQMNEYRKVTLPDAVCYIYRYEADSGDYAVESLSGMFANFYALAANAVHEKTMTTLLPEVTVTDKYDAGFAIPVPYNKDFYLRF